MWSNLHFDVLANIFSFLFSRLPGTCQISLQPLAHVYQALPASLRVSTPAACMVPGFAYT